MTGKEFIGCARALVPAVRARARQAEQLRRLPEETFREFQEAGLFRALQPARFGGFELDPVSFYEAVIEIGTACASSAWVLAVLGVHPAGNLGKASRSYGRPAFGLENEDPFL